MSEVFKKIQFGVGQKGGCKRVIHSVHVQHDIETRVMQRENVGVISVDIKNAFNSRQRSSIADILYSVPECAPLYSLFYWAHRSPSPLFIYDHTLVSSYSTPYFSSYAPALVEVLQSCEGVRQGST